VERPAGQENGGRYGQVGIQVVQWAGAILDVLRATGISFGLGPLAGETGLARSAVQRIVQALQDIGWVTPAVPDGGVFPGPGASNSPSPAAGRPTVAGQVTAGQRLRAVSTGRRDLPLHCSADGKAMLATLPDPFIETIIGRRFPNLHG
jgi:DNA-binding IclR family transcriptional regulator